MRTSLSDTTLQLFILALCAPTLAGATDYQRMPREKWRRADVPSEGYFNPLNNGGSFLTQVPETFPAGLGEPINVIMSANSDKAVLDDQQDDGGLRNYFNALGFSSECLGQHSGSDQGANLGDGNGYLNETAVIRWDYGDPTLGTCTETIKGGNHFRYWVQNGKAADSGAIFMALSYEKPLEQQHDIINNGYNLARDWLVGNATGGTLVPTSNLTNASTYSGETSAAGYTYQTSVQYVSGLLPNTSDGINHFQSMSENAVDGLVAVMTVHITAQPQQATSSSALRAFTLPSTLSAILLPIFIYLCSNRL